MGLSEISSHDAVIEAIEEFNEIGRTLFLKQYGYGPSREYFILHEGDFYDSKAILGAAHGFQFPDHGHLSHDEFSGGSQTISKLEQLGFEIFKLQANIDSVPEAPAHLFSWNPERWEWGNFDTYVEDVENVGNTIVRWSCGRIKNIAIGSRAYLIRLGREPKGIIGRGIVQSAPEEEDHWDEELYKNGEKCNYVNIEFDTLTYFPIVPLDELQEPPFDTWRWAIQQSGPKIPDEHILALSMLIETRRKLRAHSSPDEVHITDDYQEGGVHEVLVNAYERNPLAREKCIGHYGAECVVCGMSFPKTYGHDFTGIIHVHHLIPLSEIKETYTIDPVRDLRPVCPNCHAAIHHFKPPITIDELKDRLRKN